MTVIDLAELPYRLAARMVDQGAVVAAVLGGTVVGVVLGTVLPDLEFFAGILGELTALGAWFGVTVFQWFLIASEGTTLGKRLVGIRVVREDGAAVGFVDGLVVRTWVAGLLVPVTLGVFALVDVLPIFAADRRCVHDRLARTRVVLDPPGEDGVAVRRGFGFARRLAVALVAVAFMVGALVLQGVLLGVATTWIGGLVTVLLLGLAVALVVAAGLVYDCRPAGVLAAAVVTGWTAAVAGSWFAWLIVLGGTSVLAWLVASASGYLVVICALFVGPAGRVAAERSRVDEAAMLEELRVR